MNLRIIIAILVCLGCLSPRRSVQGEPLPLPAAPKGSSTAEERRASPNTDTTRGILEGTVKDGSDGHPLIEAGVEVKPLDTPAVPLSGGGFTLTGTQGKFIFELPSGSYQVKVTFPHYETKTIDRVEIQAGQTTTLDIELQQALVEIDEMRVVAKAQKETELIQLLRRKSATNIMDNIGAETIAKVPESDVAGILTRMPGMNVEEGRYMQARGMPKRYNRTLMNNATLPTTRPNEKVVPLDLFPAAVVESLNVIKSYSPDLPGNFSGGLCMIDTRSIPDRFIMKLSGTAKYNTETTFDDYLTYRGGKRDWLGYDDGTRDMPKRIPDGKIQRSGLFGKTGFFPEEIERFGEAFENNWNTYHKHAKPNQDYTFYIGDRFNQLGGILVLRYETEVQNRADERLNIYSSQGGKGGTLHLDNFYDFKRSTQTVKGSGLLNTGLELTPDHALYINNFYNRTARDEVQYYEGYNSDRGENIQTTRLRWNEEEIYSFQLRGEHHVDSFLRSNFDWRFNYSLANMWEPDLREYVYEYNPVREKYQLADETQSGFRMWTSQQEDIWDFAFDWTINFYQWYGLSSKFKTGTAYLYRSRDFWSRRFRFMPRNTAGIDLSLPIEDILKPENINPYEFELEETTRPTDTYKAGEENRAGYVMLDLPLTRRIRLGGGARYEWSNILLDSFNLFKPTERITTTIKKDDIFPAANLTYTLIDDMTIRLGYSETVSRPEFHELAPFEFTDVRGGLSIKGNPDLRTTEIKNYDFRWEWFFGTEELVAVSVFYKDITDAIEKTIQPTTELRSSFTNAKDAELFGIEFELRKNLGFIFPRLSNFSLQGNYIYTDSETEIIPQPGFVPTTLKRPLVGQADQIYNIALEYDNPNWGFTGRFLYRFIDERINEVGGAGLPDIILEESNKFDLIFIKKFRENFEMKIVTENITNEGVKYTQGGKLFRKYREGIDFKLGLSYKW